MQRSWSVRAFLEQERKKIQEAETQIRKLRSEKTELEPLVITNRETVHAVLSAYSNKIAPTTRKERTIGFVSGVLSSIAGWAVIKTVGEFYTLLKSILQSLGVL